MVYDRCPARGFLRSVRGAPMGHTDAPQGVHGVFFVPLRGGLLTLPGRVGHRPGASWGAHDRPADQRGRYCFDPPGV